MNKFNSRKPSYNSDTDYTTNAPSYYDDLARKNKLIEILAKRIWEYDEELAKRFEEWDKNLEDLPEDLKRMLQEWMEDGTLNEIINEEIFNTKASIEYVDSELDKKMDKNTNDIGIYQINKSKGLIDESYLDDSLIEQITGQTPINTTPAIKSIVNNQISNRAITPSLTTFVKMGKNKFEGNYTSGYVSGGIDEAVLHYGSGTVAIINVDQNVRYGISKSEDTNRLRVYGSYSYPVDGDELDGLQYVDNNKSTIVNSRDYKYLIIYLSDEYQNRIPEKFQIENVGDRSSTTEYRKPAVVVDFDKEAISAESIRHFMNIGMLVGRPSTFNVSLIRKEITISDSGAFIYAGSRRYNPSGGTYSYADIDDFFTLLVGYNVKDDKLVYFRTSDVENAQNDNIVLLGVIRNEQSELSCDFFGLYLVNDNLSDNDNLLGNDLFIHEKYVDVNVNEEVPSRNEITSDYIYNIFDSLVSDFSSYVSRKTFGEASDGSDIYMYEFIPPKLSSNSSNLTPAKKIYVQAGIHGHEWGSILTVARFFDKLCREWRNYDELQKLRFNIHFIVVPVLNVWGLNNYASGGGGLESRKNYNGVDLNRNFPSGWSYEPDKESMNYGGEEPLSEPESQLVYNFMEGNKDVIYAVGMHNFGNYPNNNNYTLWLGTNNQNTRKFLKGVGISVTSELQKKYSDFENENSLLRIASTTSSGCENEWENMGVINTLLELPYEINGYNINNSKIEASKLSVNSLANLISGVINKFPYI